jgi:glycosyltransferase involved in cell wall biosynthesis
MIEFKNPGWLKSFDFPYEKYEQIPDSLFAGINADLDKRISNEPLVSVVIPAYNEEINVLRSVATLSRLETKIPFEIIVVNNNSTDNTQLTLNRLHVRSFFEGRQGAGPARQVGQENALGKYILLADADCLYPVKWMEEMMKVLQQPGVVVVAGRYAFISEPGFPRWQLFIVQNLKNMMDGFRHIKRPFMNTYGMSMGYIRELGIQAGFILNNTAGEDGRLSYDLMQYGKIKRVTTGKAMVWTGLRTIKRDGTLLRAYSKRIARELNRLPEYFHKRMRYHIPKDPLP